MKRLATIFALYYIIFLFLISFVEFSRLKPYNT